MSMGEACCTPGPPASESGTVGKEVKMAGFDAYVNWCTGSTKAIIFASDVFGWTKPLLRKFADKAAAAGFVAVVPDYFEGDTIESEKHAVANRLESWLKAHPFEGRYEDLLLVIKELKTKGITSIGIAGFCYGAKPAVFCGARGAADAVVVLHPSLVITEDIAALKVPISILAAEFDKVTPVEKVKEYEAYLKSQNAIVYNVKIFPGVSHGWTVRYDENDTQAVSSATESHRDAIDWFTAHL